MVGDASRFFGHKLNTGSFEFFIEARKPVLEAGSGFERIVPNSVCVNLDRNVSPDVRASLFQLPFRDRTFGLAVAHEVFCTWDYDAQAAILQELRRVADAIYARQWRRCAWPGCGFKFRTDFAGRIPP